MTPQRFATLFAVILGVIQVDCLAQRAPKKTFAYSQIDKSVHFSGRRMVLQTFLAGAYLKTSPAFAVMSAVEIKTYLNDVSSALAPLPDQLKEEKWDVVRTALKVTLFRNWGLITNMPQTCPF